jgi:hypothetical protein
MISLVLAAAVSTTSPAIPASFAQACTGLEGYSADGLKVLSARDVPEGPAPRLPQSPNGGPEAPAPILPRHCVITAEIDRRTGAEGAPYAIDLELRIPASWNGRFLYQGGGGLDGMVVPALGNSISKGDSSPLALQRDFAVVSTDSGHQGKNFDDTSFAKDQESKLNYGYAAIGKVSVGAKQLISKVTGRRPDHSYFMGCSNGGREAMMAAQRFPSEFDGVLAGNPAFHLSAAAILANYSGWVYADAAKRLGTDSTKLFTPGDAALIQDALLQACDGLDGARDGMIFNHAACRFDIRKLACHEGQTTGCLDPVKADAIARAYRGPVDQAGQPIVGSWVFDSADFTPDWAIWQTGLPTPNGPLLVLQNLVRASLTDYFAFPQYKRPLAGGDAEAAELKNAAASTAAFTDATSTQFSSFAARGGKLMIVSGWSDPIFSALDLENYYKKLVEDSRQANGGDAAAFARLFLVPGMAHCGGGKSLDDFDALTALVDWVEKHQAPSSFPARGKAFPGVERPICAYPGAASYDGHGPVGAAGSFSCHAAPAQPSGHATS